MAKQQDILIITNYFPPEKGAAPNRILTLARALKKHHYHVDVVCPLPNYPYGRVFKPYRGKLHVSENVAGIHLTRLWLWASNSKNKFIRLFSMLSFSVVLFVYLLIKKTPKKVIIQCSPLFVGFFAVLACKIKRKRIVLNVSDLWPLAGLQMGILKKGRYYTILGRLERFNYKNAQLILGQSQEILTHILQEFPNKKVLLYRNFPDFPILMKNTFKSSEIKLVYAGLLGVAQGMYQLCKNLHLPDNMTLTIFGDGPEAKQIAAFCQNQPKITYKGLVSRDTLHQELRCYDITLIPLINSIYGSVPSKIFEYSRLGLPILYFSEGEGSLLVKKHQLGWVIKDRDYSSLNNTLIQIAQGTLAIKDSDQIQETVRLSFDFEKQFKEVLTALDALT